MYCVRFIRNDEQANEEFYYHKKEDALYHYRLFQSDDSNLYKTIEVHYYSDLHDELICSYTIMS